MGKWRPQQDSVHQIGPEIPLHGILMVVVSCCTGSEDVWAEFFTLRNCRCSSQPGDNQQSYGQMDVTVGLSMSERSRNTLEEVLIVIKSCCTTDWKICNISPRHIPKPCSLLGGW